MSCYALYVETKKKWYKWIYLRNRNRLVEKEFKVIGGGVGIRESYGVWDWHVHTGTFEMANQ